MTKETQVENTAENTAQVASKTTWESREEEAKTYIKDNPLYSQVVYISNDDDDCFPIPFHSLDYDLYPYVVERPTGINNPKYNWNTRQWEETSAEGQATKLNKLTKDFEEAQNEIAALKEKNNAITKENSQLSEQLESLKTLVSTNAETSTKQSAQIIQMLSLTTAKLDTLSAGTKAPIPPVVSQATPQPISQAVENTQSQASADVTPETTSEAKKEGEE